jgi:two-component system, NarL family, sensor kinase
LLLVPLSLRLARRVERYERERLAMMRLAIEASADERRRLARELHDGIIQGLAGSRYALGSVERQLGEHHLDELKGTVRITTDVLLHEIEALRTLTTTLFSSNPAQTDVREVLTGLARGIEERGPKVQLDLEELPPLPIAVTEALTQVAREALRNVQVHAGATTATISLSSDGTQVSLVVADDGCGFDPTDPQFARPGHLGLRLLEAAADRVGGRLVIRPGPRRGTEVRLTVPLGLGRKGAQRSSGEWLDHEDPAVATSGRGTRTSWRTLRR